MFCEKCGTRVDDGQPFCPNCGNRLANPAPQPTQFNSPHASAPQPAVPAKSGGVFGKLGGMKGLDKLYYPCACGLLALCFVLSLLDVYSSGGAFPMAYGAPWLLVISNVLFTVSIGLVVLDFFGKFTFKGLWIFIAAAAALILILFLITWISGVSVMGYTASVRLSVGGWFFLIFQAALTAVSVLLALEKLKQ